MRTAPLVSVPQAPDAHLEWCEKRARDCERLAHIISFGPDKKMLQEEAAVWWAAAQKARQAEHEKRGG